MPSFNITCFVKTNRIMYHNLKISYSDLLDINQNEEKAREKCKTIESPLDISKYTGTNTSEFNVRANTSCFFQYLIANVTKNPYTKIWSRKTEIIFNTSCMYVECLSKIFIYIKITASRNVTLIRRKEFIYGRRMSADVHVFLANVKPVCTKLYGVDITRLFQVGSICSNVTLSQTLFSDQQCHNNDNKKTYIEFINGKPFKKIASCNKFHSEFQKQCTNLGIVKNFSRSSNGTIMIIKIK